MGDSYCLRCHSSDPWGKKCLCTKCRVEEARVECQSRIAFALKDNQDEIFSLMEQLADLKDGMKVRISQQETTVRSKLDDIREIHLAILEGRDLPEKFTREVIADSGTKRLFKKPTQLMQIGARHASNVEYKGGEKPVLAAKPVLGHATHIEDNPKKRKRTKSPLSPNPLQHCYLDTPVQPSPMPKPKPVKVDPEPAQYHTTYSPSPGEDIAHADDPSLFSQPARKRKPVTPGGSVLLGEGESQPPDKPAKRTHKRSALGMSTPLRAPPNYLTASAVPPSPNPLATDGYRAPQQQQAPAAIPLQNPTAQQSMPPPRTHNPLTQSVQPQRHHVGSSQSNVQQPPPIAQPPPPQQQQQQFLPQPPSVQSNLLPPPIQSPPVSQQYLQPPPIGQQSSYIPPPIGQKSSFIPPSIGQQSQPSNYMPPPIIGGQQSGQLLPPRQSASTYQPPPIHQGSSALLSPPLLPPSSGSLSHVSYGAPPRGLAGGIPLSSNPGLIPPPLTSSNSALLPLPINFGGSRPTHPPADLTRSLGFPQTLICVSCNAEIQHPNDMITSICGHTFHSACLQQLKAKSQKCPTCQQNL